MTSQLLNRPAQDQRIIEHNRTWQQFQLIQQGFYNSPGIRLFYDKGTVENLAVTPEHEIFKTWIGHLIETFLVEKGIEFTPTGSMTTEGEGEASAQPDESGKEWIRDGDQIAFGLTMTHSGLKPLRFYWQN